MLVTSLTIHNQNHRKPKTNHEPEHEHKVCRKHTCRYLRIFRFVLKASVACVSYWSNTWVETQWSKTVSIDIVHRTYALYRSTTRYNLSHNAYSTAKGRPLKLIGQCTCTVYFSNQSACFKNKNSRKFDTNFFSYTQLNILYILYNDDYRCNSWESLSLRALYDKHRHGHVLDMIQNSNDITICTQIVYVFGK